MAAIRGYEAIGAQALSVWMGREEGIRLEGQLAALVTSRTTMKGEMGAWRAGLLACPLCDNHCMLTPQTKTE